ncbi:MAG TPA: protein translocase subunit SecF [Bryobacteraceae bacterium]|nr:protein translocase subunit SecF [Bryobacteraceae bacterium]
MELFKNTNYDFLGKKWPFIIASVVLSVAGLTSIIAKGGLKYGIDFKEGTLIQVKFANPPQDNKIRAAMLQKVKGEVSVQDLSGNGVVNTVEIQTEAKGQGEREMNANQAVMRSVLTDTFGQPNSGKMDLNNTSAEELANRLRDPLARAGVAMSEQQLQTLVNNILGEINDHHSGLITNFDELRSVPGMNSGIMNTLQQECYLAPFHVNTAQMVGPKVGAKLRQKALFATLYALAGMLVYIAFRFEWIYGLGAVIACFHDTLITIGLFSLFNKEISMTVIAALLTLVGYSMNDTIVIFDRIRENLKFSRKESLEAVMNRAVNQTLSRTIMTSGLTFLTVIALFIWGGPVLNGFSFALVCGIIVGTYSSVFVASPIVLFWHNYADARRKPAPGGPAGPKAPAGGPSAPRVETVRKNSTKAVR